MNRTRRVGTITLGSLLIAFGVLFLIRMAVPALSYTMILKLWPVIFVFLGFEILISNFRQKEEILIYDKTAFFLIVVLSFFAMGMAISECCISYAAHVYNNGLQITF